MRQLPSPLPTPRSRKKPPYARPRRCWHPRAWPKPAPQQTLRRFESVHRPHTLPSAPLPPPPRPRQSQP
eukprot:scaffold16350_cov61-Phaeocystis_antarctica.AAC.1